MVLGTWLPDHEAHFCAPDSTNQAGVYGTSFSAIPCDGRVCATLCVSVCVCVCVCVSTYMLASSLTAPEFFADGLFLPDV